MTGNPHHGKHHSSKVAPSVSDKHLSRIPVVLEQAEGDSHERNQETHAEQVDREVPDVVEQQKHGNNDGLADLESVDSSEDVDGVGTEDADRRHVQVVHEAKVDRVGRESKPVSEHVGDQNGGDSEIDVVDNQQRDRRNCRQKELVAPSDVKQVVHESEQDHRLQTKQTTEIG